MNIYKKQNISNERRSIIILCNKIELTFNGYTKIKIKQFNSNKNYVKCLT